MKILYVLNSGSFGGMEWHVIYLVQGMRSKGYEVHVWCLDGPIVEEFEKVGAVVTKEKISIDVDPFYIIKLSKYIKHNGISIVHAHELKAAVNAMIASTFAGIKAKISHTHTPISEWRVNPIKRIPTSIFYALMVNLFSYQEIALTKSRKKVKMKEGISEKKLEIIKNPNAVKIERFALDVDKRNKLRSEILTRLNWQDDNFIWGCVGRISKEKGHEVLIDGFSKFLHGLSDTDKTIHKLLLVGGGSEETELRRKIAQLKLEDNVHITGRFLDEDQIKYYATLDVFVHPSLAEGFGIVLIEAMVAGIPILASDLEVFYEVAGDTISTFKVGNPDDLKEKMLQISSNYRAKKELAFQAQERAVKLFSYENFIEAYEHYYLDLLRL